MALLWLRRVALALLGRYGARLRFPHLLLLTAALFALDLLVPDVLPFVDEMLLALGTLLFATWRTPALDEAADCERDRDVETGAHRGGG